MQNAHYRANIKPLAKMPKFHTKRRPKADKKAQVISRIAVARTAAAALNLSALARLPRLPYRHLLRQLRAKVWCLSLLLPQL